MRQCDDGEGGILSESWRAGLEGEDSGSWGTGETCGQLFNIFVSSSPHL